MLYTEARPMIASGDLLAFSNAGPISRLIRAWTGGTWNHVGIAWRYRARVFVMAAKEGHGVYNVALSTQLPVYWLRTGIAWTDEIEALATEQLGLPYSYPDCCRVALGLVPRNRFEVCSVYAATILKAAGIDLPEPSYTPSGLVSAMMAHGAEMREIVADSDTLARSPEKFIAPCLSPVL